MSNKKVSTESTDSTESTFLAERITLKENPRAGNLGLELKENGSRSKFPNCYDIIQPGLGRDDRWLTGIDELALSINKISNTEEREAKRASIKAEREALERLLNQDLSGRSSYWETYFVTIDTTRPLDMSNPKDRLAYHVILASGEAAPSLRETTSSPAFRTSKYYVARENEDVSIKVEKKKRYNEAIGLFMDLIKDPEKACLVGRYLDLPIKSSTPQNNAFDLFQTFLDNDEKLGSVDKFLFAMKKSPEELHIKMIYDDAISKKVIRFKEGLYYRGGSNMGKSPKEVLDWLTDPINSGELLNIQEEIENKNKFGG